MNIKTITCHDVYNYGASLQAYALMKYLENQGHSVQIIDYKPEYLDKAIKFWKLYKSSKNWKIIEKSILLKFLYGFVKFPVLRWNRQRGFDKFNKKYLKITDKTYHSNEDLLANPPDGDLYIAGSDQIWNTLFPNGKDPAFYLDFVPNNKIRASYAASFSTTKIEEGFEDFVKKMLTNIDYISVRETQGMEILKCLGINNACHVLDPVFLLTVNEWKGLIKQYYNEKYILLYLIEDDIEIEKTAEKLAAKFGWKIYYLSSGKKLKYADKNIYASPIDFLSLVNSSQMVLSNSFHGTSFSLLFEKEFYVFALKDHNQLNSRMKDILNRLQIQSRFVSSYDEIVIDKLDFIKIKQNMSNILMESYSYLDKITKSGVEGKIFYQNGNS
jgi:hypothetical protein